jgi:hypothetical protein
MPEQHLDGQPSMESSSQSTTDADKNWPSKKKIASPRRTSKSKQQLSSISTIADTVAEMQKVATETFNTIQEWAQSTKDVSRVVTPCGTGSLRTSRPTNEPKASIKLFSYAEMNPEIVDNSNGNAAGKSLRGRALRGLDEETYDNLSNFTEEQSKASADVSLESSIVRRLTACAGGGVLPNLSEMKIAVGEARAAWEVSDVKEAVGGVRDAMACGPRCGQSAYDRDFRYPGPEASVASEDSEAMRLRRLTSWGTIGTVDTSYSEATLGMLEHNVDDDGNPIDPKLLEKMMTSEKRQSQRKRKVKFEYPPISSVRECPRHNVEDLPMLFFTEEELYEIEDDRECTEMTDDVEVVAVSSSITTYDNPVSPSLSAESGKSKQSSYSDPSSGSSSAPSALNKFSAYNPTPRKWSKRKGVGAYFSFSQQEDSKKDSLPPPDDSNRGRATQRDDSSKPRRRAGTPRRGSEPVDTEEEDIAEGIAKKEDHRLIKSVQIYLRERSTNPISPSSSSR